MSRHTLDEILGKILEVFANENIPELSEDCIGHSLRVTDVEEFSVEVLDTEDDIYYTLEMNSIYNLCLQNDIHLIMI